MTLSVRNILYYLLFLFILLAGVLAVSLGIYLAVPDNMLLTDVLLLNVRQFDNSVFQIPNLLRVLITSGGSFLFSVIAYIVFLRFFKRITAPQLLFFLIYLLSLSFELLKPYSLLAWLSGASESLILFFSRLSLGGYLMGLFSVFLISLYQSGIKYQHQGVILLCTVLLSGFIAIVVPINTQSLSPSFLYPPAYQGQILWVIRGIIVIAILGSLFPRRFDRGVGITAVAHLFLMAGHALLHFSPLPLGSFSGGIMVLTGIIMSYIPLFRNFFWY